MNMYPNKKKQKKVSYNLIILCLLVNLISCTDPNKDNCTSNINLMLINSLIGSNLSELTNSSVNNIVGNWKGLDLESEGVTWLGKVLINMEDTLILVESNWIDTSKIHQVNILSPQICLELKDNNITVGSRFSKLKHLIDINQLNNSPDGYLILPLRNTNINIEMDIHNNPSLYYGVGSIDDIPDKLKIKAIIIRGANG